MEKPVGEHAAKDPAESSAKTGHRSRKSRIHNRHVTCLCQVNGEPCKKEPGQCRDAVHPDVDSDQHAMAQQHLGSGPGKRVARGLSDISMVCIYQTAATF